jgi:hypothetical protein
MNSLIEGSLAMGELITAFLVSYWTMKAFEPKRGTTMRLLSIHPTKKPRNVRWFARSHARRSL